MKNLSLKVGRWIGSAFDPAGVSCTCYKHCPLGRPRSELSLPYRQALRSCVPVSPARLPSTGPAHGFVHIGNDGVAIAALGRQ